VNKSVNPSWNAVFDITLNQNIHSGLLEAVCWDRDRFRKEYLGEFCMNVFELFPEGVSTLDDPTNEVSISYHVLAR
jgi:phosphatidylserine decarboxylase